MSSRIAWPIARYQMLPEPVIRLPGTQGTQGPQLAADRDGQRSTTCDGAAWQRSGHIGNKHLGWDATNGEEMSYG